MRPGSPGTFHGPLLHRHQGQQKARAIAGQAHGQLARIGNERRAQQCPRLGTAEGGPLGERGPSDELRLQFEAISQLPPEEMQVVKQLIEGMIIKYQSRRWDTRRGQSAA